MGWRALDTEKYEHYNDRVRVRPNPKANRPRSKLRPEHSAAEFGMVVAVDRGRYTVILDSGEPSERQVMCSRARELAKKPIVIGDTVHIVGDTSGAAGTLARIVKIAPRRTVLRRSADDSDRVERVMVANAESLLIVVAATNPEPRVGLVDRSLVAAYDAGIRPLLCVTKTDLADPTEFLQHFQGLDLEIYTTTKHDWQLSQLQRRLVDGITVFMGHSGVGKSTLINALVPDAARATGRVNEVTGRGRHTSSSSVAFRITNDSGASGWVVDTPGVRSFGLGHVSAANVVNAFAELRDIAAACPRGCAHSTDTAGCELSIAAASGQLTAAQKQRLLSLRRLLNSAVDNAQR